VLTGRFRIRRISATPAWKWVLTFLGASQEGIKLTSSQFCLLCMTDPFMTGMIEGRVLDTSPRRSEELEILQVKRVAE
jgi:hypothetical protein